MLLELLTVAMCIGGEGRGCTHAMSAYYHYNPDLQALVVHVESKAQRMMRGKEWLVYVATPIYSTASGETASFLLYKNVTLGVNIKTTSVIVTWTF